MSIGLIDSKTVPIENREEQEDCSVDVYCTVIFTPYSLGESQADILFHLNKSDNEILPIGMSYIGDIHCQRVVFVNCIKSSGDVIENEPTIVIDCSDTSSQIYLDETTVLSKLSLAMRTLQHIVYKYIGFNTTFHIGVYGFTLTEDIAKIFAYNLYPDSSLLPEDLGLLSQLDKSLKCIVNTPFNIACNLDFLIIYDTYPVILSDNPNLSKIRSTSTNETHEEIIDERDVINVSIEFGNDNNGILSESDKNNNTEESQVLLVGGISKYDIVESPKCPKLDIVQLSLFLLNPIAAISYSTNKLFVNYIQTDDGKIWWDSVSDNLHFIAGAVRDNANKLSGWLFNTAMVGYAIAGTMWVGSGFLATPASALVATGSSLILFGSGVASLISSAASVADVTTYIYDYISDPINNNDALDKASKIGALEVRNYVIGKITGGVGKRIQSKLPKAQQKKISNTEQLKRQKKLLEQEKVSLKQNEIDRATLENEYGNPRNPSKSKSSKQSASNKYRSKREKLLRAHKSIKKSITNREQKIKGLHTDIINEQSSSTLEQIFSNTSGGITNKLDKNNTIDNASAK